MTIDTEREKALLDYRKKLVEHKEVEAHLKDLKSQLYDLSTSYPQPEHEGQFITQQSTIAMKKEDPEDLV